ncbi:MAG: peptidylprolyl isomerase [Myxococcota bacterium]|nr:peptidylprolyl isomerase [Myxococcota bacterium]
MIRSPLLHFVVLGALLYGFNTAGRGTEPDVLDVSHEDMAALVDDWTRNTGRPPSDAERERLIQQFIDDELLLQVARSLGWDRDDPVVQRRLIQNVRFLDAAPEKNDAQVLAEAYALEMERSDIVVRRRLLERMRLMVGDRARSRTPTREELEAYFEAHSDDFMRPARIRLTQIHLSRDRRGASLHDDAIALVERLEGEAIDPANDLEAATALADPFLLQARLPLWSQRRLGERLGPTFAAAAFDLPMERWSGPVESSYGEHAVYVHERIDPVLPPLDDVKTKVIAELHRQWEGEAMRDVLRELRGRVEVRIALSDGSSAS